MSTNQNPSIEPIVLQRYQERISTSLRNYLADNGFTKVLVGSSGGLDSAITIALAAQAIGGDNVTAITMPSSYSSKGSVQDSIQLCEGLGVELLTCPIMDIVTQVSDTMQASLGAPASGVALENLQARARGIVLMTYSNMNGHLVLSTGNKSEASVGYCTLYGDTCGGLNLIGDLYKTEVYALARHMNTSAGRQVVPQAIIDKAPSAELAPGQKDSDNLPDYDILDPVLQVLFGTVNEGALAQEILDDKVPKSEQDALFARVSDLANKSAFKRLQLPPVVSLRETDASV
ncbi:NAD(+) synthase [Advenella sp. S44]|uniref:NAD(+) synthase n=1 Tax=Advenella sp. S44 TaxID=1982755 RepID=UPI000C2B416F|nr:NAD(+) synthase [Advenella sp. S44]PJX25408.1 NAD(+) synthase [Advenella sp. S44]